MLRQFWLVFLLTFLLTGCSFFEEKDETLGWSQQKLFVEATDNLQSGDYAKAARYYEILESRYPFGKYAHQAQLNVAYAYYRDGEHESAMAAAERFIKLHPGHPASAYAYYLRGLVNFNRGLGFFDRFIPTDTSQRDPGSAIDAYKDFSEVVRQFPESEYAEDATKRMLHLRNNLARHEIHVAQYYLKRGAFVAAANRAEYVIRNFQRTPAMRDALEVQITAYNQLGMDDLAADAQRVLAANEDNGSLIPDPRDLEEKGVGRELWESLDVDN